MNVVWVLIQTAPRCAEFGINFHNKKCQENWALIFGNDNSYGHIIFMVNHYTAIILSENCDDLPNQSNGSSGRRNIRHSYMPWTSWRLNMTKPRSVHDLPAISIHFWHPMTFQINDFEARFNKYGNVRILWNDDNWWVVWNIAFIFPIQLGSCHHPNWRTHSMIFQGARFTTTNQRVYPIYRWDVWHIMTYYDK